MKQFLFTILLSIGSFVCSQEYWQQEVNYKIDVKLDDKKHQLLGYEELEYINNSPDQLDTIYFHLWPNAYKNTSTALCKQMIEMGDLSLYYAEKEDRGFIDSLDFKINGTPTKWEITKEHIDICYLIPETPIQPSEKITITTPFKVKIPSAEFSRLGHDGQSYYITQWYPKPAVYDNNGWNPMPYIQHGEFYSEYGSFDVKITLPKNYRVAATGDLVGDNAETEKAFIDSLVSETEKIETFDIKDMEYPESSDEFKTIELFQKDVHDFAWFTDKRYHVLKGSVKLPNSSRSIDTYAFFTNNEAHLWKNSIEYISDATYYYSLWNGDYPYNQVTAVDGVIAAGGGMEYPNVTIIGESGSALMLEYVIVHEVGHNWFYGILGSNERENAWMDEGINSYNEIRYLETKYPDANFLNMFTDQDRNVILGKTIPKLSKIHAISYLTVGRSNIDQPIQTSSADFTSGNYSSIVYSKTAVSLKYLQSYLGQEIFDKCMKRYFYLWKFKHPQPEDLRIIFEEVSKEDLSWFFEDLIKSANYLDYRISNYDDKSDSLNVLVTITNKGTLTAPFCLTAYGKKGYSLEKAWYQGIDDKAVVKLPKQKDKEQEYTKIVIDAEEETIELYRDNNRLNTEGLFKTFEPIKFDFIGNLENSRYNQVFWAPVVGWNQSNGTLFGVNFYNKSFPQEKFIWHFMPLIGVQTKDLNGSYSLKYHVFKKNNQARKRLTIGYDFKRYATLYGSEDDVSDSYLRNHSFIEYEFKKSVKSPFNHTLSLNNYNIQNNFNVLFDSTNTLKFSSLRYQLDFSNGFRYVYITSSLDFLPETSRFNAELNSFFRYPNSKSKGVSIRLFGGSFLSNKDTKSNLYRYRLSSWTGKNDFMYDHSFFARNNNNPNDLLSRQMVYNDGGFIYQHFWGQCKWLISSNLYFNTPIKMINLFTNLAYLPSTDESEELFVYELGARINVIQDFFSIYIPFTASQEILDAHNIYNYSFLQSIRFTLNLEKVKIHDLENIIGI